jgi:hypothetical protein
VFQPETKPGHIPERARRSLGTLDASLAREVHADALARLNR